MFSHTALGAALSSSTLLCLRSSFRPPAAGLGLPGGVILRAVLTTGGGVVLPGLLSSRREVERLSGGRVTWMLLLSSRRDIDLRTGLLSRPVLALAAKGIAAVASSPREIVREGARLGATRLRFLRWVRSFVPVGRANHLAPRCWRPRTRRPGVFGKGEKQSKAAAKESGRVGVLFWPHTKLLCTVACICCPGRARTRETFNLTPTLTQHVFLSPECVPRQQRYYARVCRKFHKYFLAL